jgi:acrylyl-CoA reductase (NADPH)
VWEVCKEVGDVGPEEVPLFSGLVLRGGETEPVANVETLGVDDLPEGDVLIDVAYSSLNYKDALAVTGAGKIVRFYPMVPGIDMAGTVVDSSAAGVEEGQRVIVTGWGVGEAHWGGMADYARVRSDWVVPLPEGLSLRHSMALGTAGLTAMLSVMALEHEGLTPEGGQGSDRPEVLVTGASGGVGSISVMLLAGAGYRVVASTGRHDSVPYLHQLGAEAVVERGELEAPGRPLEVQRWAAAIDTTGGAILSRVLAEMRYGGAVAACGLAGGAELHTTVMPFILRAVRLVGINSVSCPTGLRVKAWERLARDIDPALLESSTRVIGLGEVVALSRQMVAGRGRGRTVVELKAET